MDTSILKAPSETESPSVFSGPGSERSPSPQICLPMPECRSVVSVLVENSGRHAAWNCCKVPYYTILRARQSKRE